MQFVLQRYLHHFEVFFHHFAGSDLKAKKLFQNVTNHQQIKKLLLPF